MKRQSTADRWIGFAIVALLIAAAGFFAPKMATADGSISEQSISAFELDTNPDLGFRNGSFIAAPIPFSDPTFGNGLVVVGGFLFQSDASSSTSNIGIGVMASSTGSFGYGLSTKLFFDENRWQFGLMGGHVDLFYDFYVLGVPVPLRQTGDLIQFTGAYGLTPEFAIGVDVRYIKSSIVPDITLPAPIEKAFTDLGTVAILNTGLSLDWDRRDDSIYPTKGTNLSFDISRGFILEGFSKDYTKSVLLFDAYFPLFNSNVIAARVAACASAKSTPFYDSCSLGGVDAFRGFPVTQFIDNRLVSAQLAWRGQFTKRLGYSIFGGIGNVGGSFDTALNGEMKVATGIGARYAISKKFPVTFSVDAAVNNFGDQTVYVYIGQRF